MNADQNKILAVDNSSVVATLLGQPSTTMEGLPLSNVGGEIALKVVNVTQVPTLPPTLLLANFASNTAPWNVASLGSVSKFRLVGTDLYLDWPSKATTITVGTCNVGGVTVLNFVGCSALTVLNASSKGLQSLNLAGLQSLTSLSCQYNSIKTLDLSPCPALTAVFCQNSLTFLLTSLILLGTKLVTLDCSGNRGLGAPSLNFSGQSALQDLNCTFCDLASIDLSFVGPSLVFLRAGSNLLTTVNFGVKPNIVSIFLNDNKITSLNLSGLVATNISTANFRNNLMPSALVDAIWIRLEQSSQGSGNGDTAGTGNGPVVSVAAQLAIVNLTSAGWDCQFN